MKKLAITVLCTSSLAFGESYYPIGFPLFKQLSDDRRIEKMSESFMFTRPIYDNISAKQSSFWHEALWQKVGCWGSSVQIMPMYQQSLFSPQVARYFFIDHQHTLVIRGDNVPPLPSNPNVRNIRAEWLTLPDTFFGTISINPRQRQFGLWVEASQNIQTFLHHEFFKDIWFGVAFPFQTVENSLRPTQERFSPPTDTFPATSIEAFNRGTMAYGKISPTKRTERGVSEVYFRFGTTFLARDGFVIGLLSALVAPTVGPAKADYLFNPFLGHNGAWGFETAAHFELPLNRDVDCKLITLFFDIDNLFFLRNYQWRTLDLRFKQFSRYLLLNRNDGIKNIPGVNVLTRRVKVNPFNFVDLCAGFRFQFSVFEVEVAYNLWAHGDEEICLAEPFPEIYGIAGDGALVPGTNIGATANESNIRELAPNDVDGLGNPIFLPLHEYDLDFRSGIARAAVTHRASFAIGAIHDECRFALFWGVGGFVEIPQENTALKQWGVWGKVGGTF